MRFTTTVFDFLPVVKICAGILDRKVKVPILAYGLLSIDRKSVTLRATNLDVEAELSVPVEGIRKGKSVSIPLFQMDALLKTFPKNASITLATRPEGGIEVTAPFGKYTMPTLPAEDFASPIVLENPVPLIIDDASSFMGALRRAYVAVSMEETRYYLNGACLDFQFPDAPVIVATDGHRLIREPIKVSRGKWPMPTAIIARDFVQLMMSLPITDVSFEEFKIEAKLPGGIIRGKMIDGTFPDWRRVVPKDETITLVANFNTADMLKRLRRITAMSSKLNSIVMTIAPSGQAVIGRWASDVSACEKFEVGIEQFRGAQPASLCFNADYLLDLCRTYPGEVQIRTSVDSESQPAMFYSGESLYVLMPMRDAQDGKAKTLAELSAGETRAA